MNCTLWSAAYLLGISSEILIKEIGHDGMEIKWPEYDDVRKHRGYSLAEIQNCFWMRNKLLAPIFLCPMVAPDTDAKAFHLWSMEECGKRYYHMTKGTQAIIVGTLTNGIGHAVVLDRDGYVDPRTGKKESSTPEDYRPQEAYVVCQAYGHLGL